MDYVQPGEELTTPRVKGVAEECGQGEIKRS
jgi:hypothetical protein